MITYRSIAAMSKDVRSWVRRLPNDVDLIVGVPRSGLLVANILALHMNRQIADVEGFIDGRIIGAGFRCERLPRARERNRRRILVVDDSVNSGRELERVRAKIAAANSPDEVRYAALYVTPGSEHLVDYFYEVVPQPRVFEWNVFHHDILSSSCVDIDGVLCRDPTPEENDDGGRYEIFIREVDACLRPTVKIGCLVTCRLEKYRAQTEEWLRRWDIPYDRLIMLDLPDKESRRRKACHARFKAAAYVRVNASLFIESSARQASEIAKWAARPVFCVENGDMIYPGVSVRLERLVHRCLHDPSKVLAAITRRARTAIHHAIP